MSRKKIGVQMAPPISDNGRAKILALELKSNREFGQPFISEEEYSTKKTRVTVIWDEWADVSLEDRSATILRSYEIAEGKPARDKIALATGLTVPEAVEAGFLPYYVIPGLRKSDPVTREEVQAAMLNEGASKLAGENNLQLRIASLEEAKACVQRLSKALPNSEPIWIVGQELRKRE